MRAVRVHEHGGPGVLRLEEIEAPAPRAGEVQVRVRAAALNHLDVWVRRGVPGHRFPLPITPGCDGAGVVSAVGAGVAGVKEGDEVVLAPGHSCGRCTPCSEGSDNLCRDFGILGETRDGTNADFIVIPAVNALPKPATLTFEQAAAVPLAFLTAWGMLVEKARVRPGDVVLVQAGGSGVGVAAIQVAKLHGATVIATASTEAKRRAARSLGADHVVDYTTQDWSFRVRELTGKQGVDLVVEHVGAATFLASLRTLKKGGTLAVCGATAGFEVTLDLRPVYFRNLRILGSTMGSRGSVHRVLQLAGQGRLAPVIDRVLPLARVAEAHAVLEERAQFGKVVLSLEG
jgi:NADPH:quinone reductase-like Zn-dependent oxidoreductase